MTAVLRGILPVLATPFDAADGIDEAGFVATIDAQVRAGVSGVMFPGFASEFHKLSESERRHLTRVTIARLRDHAVRGHHVPVAVISIPDHATALAVARTEEAVAEGADAINLLPPFLFGPTPDAIRAHVEAVLLAAGRVPVILQHAPSETGGDLDPAWLAGIARRHPNLRTVKVESAPPGPLIAELAAGDPPLAGLTGYAGLHAVDAYAHGGVGLQPGSSFPELYVRFDHLWVAGETDAATALHARLRPYLETWMTDVETIVAVEKVIAHERGWIATPRVRTPGRPVTADLRAGIDAFLTEFAADLVTGPAPAPPAVSSPQG